MKHLGRIFKGSVSVLVTVMISVSVFGLYDMIDSFVKWKYRNDALAGAVIIAILYLIGMLVELTSDKGRRAVR